MSISVGQKRREVGGRILPDLREYIFTTCVLCRQHHDHHYLSVLGLIGQRCAGSGHCLSVYLLRTESGIAVCVLGGSGGR